MFASPHAQEQARETSARIRSERAHSKRSLKAGSLHLRTALDQDCWQDRPVLELLGYALIGHAAANPIRCTRAGETALRVCAEMEPQLGHFTLVADLSEARRHELCQVAGELRSYATLRGAVPQLRALS